MYPYGLQPPEINSGMVWTGPGSGALAASAAAWQELAAQLGSSGAAFSTVVQTLSTGSWTGPSSISMALAAAPYVVWMLATAAQCQEAAMAAAQAAMVFEAAHAGVVPPPEIAENRTQLATLIGTNFMGCNAGPIAATEADYERMWSQDGVVLQGYSADAAGVTGSLIPFIPPSATTDPAGLASQAASIGQATGTGAGNVAQNITGTSSQALPGGLDSSAMLTMGPQLVSTIPEVLQGIASPLSSGGNPLSSLGGFQSLLSPFMSMMSNPGAFGAGAGAIPAAVGPAVGAGAGGVNGLGAGGGAVSAAVGRGGSLGGLSVPATWAASAQTSGAAGEPVTVSATTPQSAAPASAGSGMGGAPMAAMAGRDGSGAGGPRYGTPIRVLPRPR